jgi:hypothetical protein
MTDVVILTKLPFELFSREAGCKTCQLYPKQASEVKGGLGWALPSFHPGVKDKQVTGL